MCPGIIDEYHIQNIGIGFHLLELTLETTIPADLQVRRLEHFLSPAVEYLKVQCLYGCTSHIKHIIYSVTVRTKPGRDVHSRDHFSIHILAKGVQAPVGTPGNQAYRI